MFWLNLYYGGSNFIRQYRGFWIKHRAPYLKKKRIPKIGGCVTVKVNGHVIERLTLKIDKNVKTVEIDHNGAYRCICEYLKTLFVPILIDLSSDSSQKKHFKVSEKWRLFCFVFVLFCRLQNSVSSLAETCHFSRFTLAETRHFSRFSPILTIRPISSQNCGGYCNSDNGTRYR